VQQVQMAWEGDIVYYYSYEDDSTNRSESVKSIKRIEILQYSIGFYDLDRDSTWILSGWDS
jgi:hypothetical protein